MASSKVIFFFVSARSYDVSTARRQFVERGMRPTDILRCGHLNRDPKRRRRFALPAHSKLLKLRRPFFNKRRMRFFEIRRLHAESLCDCFGLQRGFEAHVQFTIQHLFGLRDPQRRTAR